MRFPYRILLCCLVSVGVFAQDPVEDRVAVDTVTHPPLSDNPAASSVASVKEPSPDAFRGKITELPPMVVTATRSQRTLAQLPFSVSIISDKALAVSPSKNIDDMLQKQTGIQMRRSVGMGEGVPGDLIMRAIPGALAGTRTLVLVDGIPTNASGTPFLILNEIPMETVKSVEIVRGPCSHLYGANAFSGVVNIITKSGSGPVTGSVTGETSLPFSIGYEYFAHDSTGAAALKKGFSKTYWNLDGSVSGSKGRVSLLASGGVRTIGNYMLADSALARVGDSTFLKPGENYNYKDQRIFLKTGFRLNDAADLEIHARLFNSALGFGQTRYTVPAYDVDMDGTKLLIGPRFRIALNSSTTLRVNGYLRRLTGRYRNEEPRTDSLGLLNLPSYWESASDEIQGEAQLSHSFTVGRLDQSILAGAELLRNSVDFDQKSDYTTGKPIPGSVGDKSHVVNGAVLLQDEAVFADRLTIIPGCRIDHHSTFGTVLSPRVSSSVQIVKPLLLRASVGRGFRAPTLSELAMPDLAAGSTMIIRANPDLKPEYVRSYDGGIHFEPFAWSSLDVGVFRNTMRNMVDKEVVPSAAGADSGRSIITHRNVARAWSQGVECELSVKPRGALQGSIRWVFQDSRNEHAADVRLHFLRSKGYVPDDMKVPLDYIPQSAGTFSLTGKQAVGRTFLTIDISESYVGQRRYQAWNAVNQKTDVLSNGTDIWIDPPLVVLDAYWRTDGSLGVTLRDRITATLCCQNIFNAQFEESDGSYAPGRFASVKVSVAF